MIIDQVQGCIWVKDRLNFKRYFKLKDEPRKKGPWFFRVYVGDD